MLIKVLMFNYINNHVSWYREKYYII